MYKSIKLVPADGSTLTKESPRCTDMVSLDEKITITFKNNNACWLKTGKGHYPLKQSYDGTVYYTTIGKWYVCFNGVELSWKSVR